MKFDLINRHATFKDILDLAYNQALIESGCNKVAVGSAIVIDHRPIVYGANRGIPDLCKTHRGCLRVEKYGDDSKNHRNPADCRAIHSEVDAICTAAALGIRTKDATIVVTRYPCESCAKAIIAAGISKVIYGGTASVSPETAHMFASYEVDCIHIKDWKEDNTDR